MSASTDRLYQLLPAIYRARDITAGGEALRALLGVIESEFATILGDVDELYDNWFIETCADWLVPYIGDLLGVRELNEIPNGAFSRRAYVANTVAYRQRKGTPAAIEQLAHDVTGWPARVVEYFQLLAVTQHAQHVRPGCVRLDIRNAERLELLGTPFERAAYSGEVRRISRQRGRYNIPSVGLHLWRLAAYPMTHADASHRAQRLPSGASDPVPADDLGLFRFNSLGSDMPLFNRPQTEASINTLAQEINVPGRLRRRPLYDELEARRAAIDAGTTPHALYFGEQPVFELFRQEEAGDPFVAVAPESVRICDLSDWRRPPEGSEMISVDPVLGRIALPVDLPAARLRVSYASGFSADIGGGSYNRRSTLVIGDVTIWKAVVTQSRAILPGEVAFTSITDALEAFAALDAPRTGIIEIEDSTTYDESAGLVLHFDAPDDPDDGQWLVLQARDGARPTVVLPEDGFIISSDHDRTEVTLNGILFWGGGIALPGDLGRITITHCTLVPGISLAADGTPEHADTPSLTAGAVAGANGSLEIIITSSITGALHLPREIRSLTVRDSIVDALGAVAIGAPLDGAPPEGDDPTAFGAGPATTLERTTVFGSTIVEELTLASEVIFDAPVTAHRRQTGCVRFSWVPAGSRTPRRFHCESETAERTDVDGHVSERLRPAFTSRVYGHPAYAQLAMTTAPEILTGAENGSEIGVFNQLDAPQREANLRIGLDEYMRLGLDTGIFYVT